MHPFINVATEAIEQAGITVFKALQRPDRFDVREKSVNNPVSNIDYITEAQIAEILNTAYPTHTIIGEESGEIHQGDGGFVWLIDPLDGTINYLHGIPHFCISIGCRSDKQLEHGLILDPVRRELFTATHGQGALLNRQRIQVTRQTRMKSAIISCGLPYTGRDGDLSLLNRFALEAGTQCLGLRQLGSSALDLAYVAAGRFDVMFDSGLKIWDMAAGALLVQEAGGLISDHDGDRDFLLLGDLVAGTPRCQRAVLRLVKSLKEAAEVAEGS